jgi:hypothetical protein
VAHVRRLSKPTRRFWRKLGYILNQYLPTQPLIPAAWLDTFGGCPMERWVSGISQHGYAILFAAIFLESVGFPLHLHCCLQALPQGAVSCGFRMRSSAL